MISNVFKCVTSIELEKMLSVKRKKLFHIINYSLNEKIVRKKISIKRKNPPRIESERVLFH